jgi:ubiquinone/menaquinone biosynthesis C-methylase UbiE
MPASSSATPKHIKDVNTRYHDAAATGYDGKWGIDFGPIGQDQVRRKLRKALGDEAGSFDDALEVGAGTGYFSLNLLQLGLIQRATASDISPGMLATLERNASRLGVRVETAISEAGELPFDDASFDLVFGHAVLHHLPDLTGAMGEFARVLRPGGMVAFCGEPSRYGDRIAALPKRAGTAVGPLWRRLVRAGAQNGGEAVPSEGHELESEVDVHAFAPGDLAEALETAGFEAVRIRGEELLANMYGWALRSVEATADPDEVPWGWSWFAFRSYIALQRVDESLLEPRLPPQLFYNLVLSARRPATRM